jgi:hypothetical protein
MKNTLLVKKSLKVKLLQCFLIEDAVGALEDQLNALEDEKRTLIQQFKATPATTTAARRQLNREILPVSHLH